MHVLFLLLQIAGIVFPVPVLLLIPIRQYVLPRVFSAESLRILDPACYEEDNCPVELSQPAQLELAAGLQHAQPVGDAEVIFSCPVSQGAV